MGDWCSEGCNRILKEISARVKMSGPNSSGFTRKTLFLAEEKFLLLTGAF